MPDEDREGRFNGVRTSYSVKSGVLCSILILWHCCELSVFATCSFMVMFVILWCCGILATSRTLSKS